MRFSNQISTYYLGELHKHEGKNEDFKFKQEKSCGYIEYDKQETK